MNKQDRPSLTPPSVWRNPWHFIAFGFGSGAIQPGPGTWGTLVGLLFVPLLQWLPLWAYAAAIVAGSLFGFWLCGKVSRDLGVHDHGGIVWDEIVGIWISLFLLPADWVWWVAGFVVFRILDIAKPWPIRWADRNVHGGLGIMLDDLMAGALTCAILHGARLLLA